MTIQQIDRGTAGNPNDRFKIGTALDTAQANDEYLDSVKPTVIENFAALASTPVVAGKVYYLKEYNSGTGLGGGNLLAYTSTDTPDNGIIFASGTAGIRLKRIDYTFITPEMFGFETGLSANPTTNKACILLAIAAMRSNGRSIQQNAGMGAPMITAYSSGTLKLGRGIYLTDPDISIEQDLGLTFEGEGSRGTNNSIFGATTLLFSGSTVNYGIRSYGNGARYLRFKNLDICYLDAGFTGDVIDNYDAVGLKLDGCYAGTFGIGTVPYPRRATARSVLRQTYDEFTHIVNTVFSGAVDLWYDDASRTIDGSTFGGSLSKWDTVTFYDCTGNMMVSSATRARETMAMVNCAFNPITQDCSRALYLQNVVNLSIEACFAVPSTVNKATVEWATLLNCHGKVQMEYGGLAKAGTFSGALDLSGSAFGGTDGATLKSGSIFSRSCKFVSGTNGWLIANDDTLQLDIGLDIFSSGVTTSYYLPIDSATVRGRISYSAENDSSTGKFEVNSSRVRVINDDESIVSSSSASLSIPFTQTGRKYIATAGANQDFELPTPRFCTKFTVSKFSDNAYTLTVDAPAGKNFMAGGTTPYTSAAATGEGCSLTFEAVNADTYIVTSLVGAWTLT